MIGACRLYKESLSYISYCIEISAYIFLCNALHCGFFFCSLFDVYREYGYVGRWRIFWIPNTMRSYSQPRKEWRQSAVWSTLLSAMTLSLSVARSVSLAILRSQVTFTHTFVGLKLADVEGGWWKIGFNTYHFICSHMHGRRTVMNLEKNLQGMGTATPSFPCTSKPRAPYHYLPSPTWQSHSKLSASVYVTLEAEWGCWNPLFPAPQPLCSYENVPSWALF